MLNAIEQALQSALGEADYIGEIAIRPLEDGGFELCHRDDQGLEDLPICNGPEQAVELSKFDDAQKYRPLKTAPNLRHGWRLKADDLSQLAGALNYFYPGRLAMLEAWTRAKLEPTPLRETLNRQSGMYRVAAKISDEQLDNVVADFCRSDGGCLRTILWKRDASGRNASPKLPPEKFDPAHDQTGRGECAIPLLCQEACNLLVNECRKAVKGE